MFDFVHEKKRLVQIVLAIIILPFAFWGVDSYDRSGNAAGVIATVNGAKITQQEFGNALSQQQDKLREQLGDNFNLAMLDNPEMKRAVMESLVEQRLMLERALDVGLVVTDAQVARVISGIEAFQDKGKFDKKRYAAILESQGRSPMAFEAQLRDELLWQQVQDIYLQNGYASYSVVENVIRLNEQQRIVSMIPFTFHPFMAQVKVDQSAIKKYYDKNMQEFQVGEQAKVEYVKFTTNDLLTQIDVSNEAVRQYYDEHQNEFGAPEERQAAHILISLPANASQAQQDAARARSEQVLQQVKNTPTKFSELAKQNSQDPGSATNGGDLGYFGRGMMVKPFEDAVFSLKPGEISELVKSDFGFHIIKLIAIKASKAMLFEEVRDVILSKLRQQKSADKYVELAEKFSNTVYEQSDTLKPAADLVGTKIQRSGWLINGVSAGEPWTEKMLQAIFNEEIVKNKRNTAAIEVAPNTLVSARVLEYKPSAVRAFTEVEGLIQQKLLRQRAFELATEQGKATLAKFQSGDNPKLSWNPAQTITRARPGSLDERLVKQVFQTNPAKFPHYVGVEVDQYGYFLARIDTVKDGDVSDADKRTRYAQQLRQLTGEEIFRAYLASAKQSASITVSLPEAGLAQP